jgi:hypothetical protein
MHGLDSAFRVAGRQLLRSPPPLFGGGGSQFRSLPASLPDRHRRLETTFRSSVATARFRATTPESTFLACFFNVSRDLPQTRSDPDSSTRPVGPVPGRITVLVPLPASDSAIPTTLQTCTPLSGFLGPVWIEAVCPQLPGKRTFPLGPIFFRSPKPDLD